MWCVKLSDSQRDALIALVKSQCEPGPAVTAVLEALGVTAGEALMVGDDCASDMVGAKALGMGTVWKLNGRYDAPPCAAADFAIHDLGELVALPLLERGPQPLVTTESLTPHEDGNADRY